MFEGPLEVLIALQTSSPPGCSAHRPRFRFCCFGFCEVITKSDVWPRVLCQNTLRTRFAYLQRTFGVMQQALRVRDVAQERLSYRMLLFCKRPSSLCSARRGCVGGGFRFVSVHPRYARPPAALRYRSSAVPRASRRGQTNARLYVWVHELQTRFVLCNIPHLTAFGRTPASERRVPRNGGLISRAFLAHVVRVPGEGGPRQQKANPDVDWAAFQAPILGAASSRRGGPAGCVASEGGALHNANAFLCNSQKRRKPQTRPTPRQPNSANHASVLYALLPLGSPHIARKVDA